MSECIRPFIARQRSLRACHSTVDISVPYLLIAHRLLRLHLVMVLSYFIDFCSSPTWHDNVHASSTAHSDLPLSTLLHSPEGTQARQHGPHRMLPSRQQQACNQLLTRPVKAQQASIMLRLPMQVCEHLQPFSRACDLRVVPVVGGLAPAKQQRLLGKRPAVVVATPGRLWELMRSGEPHLSDLTGMSHLVLDEADRMVQAGHFQVGGRLCLPLGGADRPSYACMLTSPVSCGVPWKAPSMHQAGLHVSVL